LALVPRSRHPKTLFLQNVTQKRLYEMSPKGANIY